MNSTFMIDCDGLIITLTITEVGDGTLEFDVAVTGELADIRGVFFNMLDETLTAGLSVEGDDVTDSQFANNAVTDLGNGANMNGSESKTGEALAPFDAGVEIGTEGTSPDDIQNTTFIVSHATEDLTLADIDLGTLGIRLTSTPNDEGGRTNSLKLIFDEPPNLPPTADPEKINVFEEALDPNADGDDLAGADTTGSNPDSTAETVTGTLTFNDPDGTAFVTSVSFDGGADVPVPQDGTTVQIAGDFGTLEIDQFGNYTYTLTTNSLDHTTQGTGVDGVDEDFVYTVTDDDGATASSTFTVCIHDDVPTADIERNGNMAITDESVGLPDPDGPGGQVGNDENGESVTLVADVGTVLIGKDTSDIIDLGASHTVGADTAGATQVITLEIIGGDGTDSGLDTTDGTSILLSNEGGTIVGRAGGVAIFAMLIANDGTLTLEQYDSLKTTNNASFDEAAFLGTGIIQARMTVTDGDGDVSTDTVDLGGATAGASAVKFEDDGPTLGAIPDSTDSLPFAIGMEMKNFSFDVGEDDEGAPGLALVDFTDPDDAGDLAASGLGALEALLGEDITAAQVGNVVTYSTSEGDLFKLTLSDEGGGTGKWKFEILQDAPFVALALDLGALEPGSPTESEILAGVTGSGLDVVFDGLNWRDLAGGDTSLDNPAANLGPGNTADDINTNQQGFGIKDGQASQVNNLEGFFARFGDGAGLDDDEVVGFFFDIEGIGNIDFVDINYLVWDDLNNNGVVDGAEVGTEIEATAHVELPGGNNEVQFLLSADPDFVDPGASVFFVDLPDGFEFDNVYIQAITPDGVASDDEKDWNDGVRFNDFGTIERTEIPPLTLEFAAKVTDGDGDMTPTDDWLVFVG